MIPLPVACNVFMLGVDVWALAVLRRERNITSAVTVCLRVALVGLAMVLLVGGIIPGGRFLAFRLLACVLFLHQPIMLTGSAVLLRRTRPKTAAGLVALAALIVGVSIDAFWIEPTWLEVSHVRLTSAKLDRRVRIVVLADLQTDVFGAYEKRVLRRVLAEQPDLVLLAGDYLHANSETRRELSATIGAYLKEIQFGAPRGVFAVRGNIDPHDWDKLFDRLPIVPVHQSRSYQLPELQLTCLGVRDSFSRSLAVGNPVPDKFHVVLGHAPNFALGQIEADLLISGHTHGGQVRLPMLGPIITFSTIPRGWAAGLTDLPGGGQLCVSRGVGMERGSAPRIRFLCRPELVVIDLLPE